MKIKNNKSKQNEFRKTFEEICAKIKLDKHLKSLHCFKFDTKHKALTLYLNDSDLESRIAVSLRNLSPLLRSELSKKGFNCEIVIKALNDYIDEYFFNVLGFAHQVKLLNWGVKAPLNQKRLFLNSGSCFSLVDMLQFIPKFQNEVKQIRQKLNINVKKIKGEASKLLGLKDWLYYEKCIEFYLRELSLDDMDHDRLQRIEKRLQSWEKEKFTDLKKLVGRLRVKKIKKMPRFWQRAIEQYVLYELKNSFVYLLYRKTLERPQIALKLDKQKHEPYLEIKVYQNTSLDLFKKFKNIKDLQKLIPTYFDPKKYNHSLNEKRFLYFVLRRHLSLKHNQACDWLEEKGFGLIEPEHAGLEINRFLGSFGKSFTSK
ncbi:MAG: hypothetical protein HQ536_04055 [Parcubacteria group bacterium]|nr:hypothetical protein [Parcubacteria group bacterium]